MERIKDRKVCFVNIDDWNRPVFKDIKDSSRYFGCIDTLFPYGETEKEVLKKVVSSDLVYFGTCFNCEPMGTPARVTIIPTEKMSMNDIYMSQTVPQTFEYMMLNRLQSDCLYVLYHPFHVSALWGITIESHMQEMYRLYEVLEIKPEWLSLDDIKRFEQELNYVCN